MSFDLSIELKSALSDSYSEHFGFQRSGLVHSGIPIYDVLLGCGGIVPGMMFCNFGVAGSGKTTSCLHTSVSALKSGYDVIYIDGEMKLQDNFVERDYLRKMHKEGRFMVKQFRGIQAAISGLDTICKFIRREKNTLEKKKAEVRKKKNLSEEEKAVLDKPQKKYLIVIDSINYFKNMSKFEDGALSEDDIKKEFSVEALFWSKYIPNLAYDARTLGIAFLAIAQHRQTIGVPEEAKAKTPGEAWHHAFVAEMQHKRSKKLKDAKGQVFATEIKISAKKNQLGKENIESTFLITKNGAHWHHSLFMAATHLGFVEKSGAWCIYGETESGDPLLKSQGVKGFVRAIAENKKIRDMLITDVYGSLANEEDDPEGMLIKSVVDYADSLDFVELPAYT